MYKCIWTFCRGVHTVLSPYFQSHFRLFGFGLEMSRVFWTIFFIFTRFRKDVFALFNRKYIFFFSIKNQYSHYLTGWIQTYCVKFNKKKKLCFKVIRVNKTIARYCLLKNIVFASTHVTSEITFTVPNL